MKHSKAIPPQCSPIVFMNSPISSTGEDIIGIDSTVDSISCAIDHGARMIGVIADYGTGKSSLTDTLAVNKKEYGKAIRINMWDSLCDTALTSKDAKANNSVSPLIQSFLYQLASGISYNTARHVNRRMSKNYSIISFSLSSLWFWLYASIAALAYLLYSVLDNTTALALQTILIKINVSISQDKAILWSNILKCFSPAFWVIGIASIILGLRNTSIAFSNWKSQEAREPEINDVFDTYSYVYKRLLDWHHRRLVIVEDLDRVVNKAIIVSFLKELYRFNNISGQTRRKQPVFVISVKPESMLKFLNEEDEIAFDDNDIYAKIFDYSVSLKPIHYDDYKDILLSIIGDENSETREALQKALSPNDQIKNDLLPVSFNWLVKGNNLTIRELKDRLNHAVSLLVSLNNKGYSSQPYINFASCSAVAYLELQYPEAYNAIIRNENDFAQLIRESYKIKNILDETQRNTSLTNSVHTLLAQSCIKSGVNIDDLKSDLVKMIFDGDIDNDFRMYFYSYPKGSYIKTSDEKDISNLLLLPYNFPSDDSLNEKIERIIDSKKAKTIINLLEQISKDSQFNCFPAIIINNKYLFQNAYEIDQQKVEYLIQNEASWAINKINSSKVTLDYIFNYHINKQDAFWQWYGDWLLDRCASFEDSHIIDVRIGIIDVFKGDILRFSKLFLSHNCGSELKTMPIISEQEISKINNIDITIHLVDKLQISNDNIIYISKAILENTVSDVTYRIAKDIIDSACALLPRDLVRPVALMVLMQNCKVDDVLFSFACENDVSKIISNDIISKYINCLETDDLTETYLNIIDARIIENGLAEPVLAKLTDNKKYISVLASYLHENCLNKIDFRDESNIMPVISACATLNTYDDKIIPHIRREIIIQDESMADDTKVYKKLFFDQYPIITKEELYSFSSFICSVYCIDASKINESNYNIYVEYFNDVTRSTEECFSLFDSLFNNKYNGIVSDSNVARLIVDNINYCFVPFKDMPSEQKEAIVVITTALLDLNEPSSAIAFMKKTECLIESLEKLLVNNGLISDYVDLINYIENPTEYTIQWLRSADVTFRLPEKITTILLKEKVFSKYLIGKTLNEKSFVFPIDEAVINAAIEQYFPTSPIFEYLAGSIDFADYLIETKEYEKFDPSNYLHLLQPLYKGKQTLDFVQFLFQHIDDSEKKVYLESMVEIKDAVNSKDIAYFLLEDSNIVMLEDDALFVKVRENLWEDVPTSWKGYKAYFSRRRNERFPKKRHELPINML